MPRTNERGKMEKQIESLECLCGWYSELTSILDVAEEDASAHLERRP